MHTIIPALAQKNDKPFLSFGVMGGHYQPMGQAHVLSNIIDYNMDPQESLDLPRSFYFDGILECEKGISVNVKKQLELIGHKVEECDLPHGGGQVIQFNNKNGSLIGGSDSRKDGCAIGL
jgi:gamma-glutamyltranspeptidase/glutathione hydrolase